MKLPQLAGVSLLCVGLQRLLADALLGVVHVMFRVSRDTSFYGVRLLPGFWRVLACISGAVVLSLLLRDLRRKRVRHANAVWLAATGVLALGVATQVGTATAVWQAWTPSRQDSMPLWACLAVDTGMTLCGLWLLRSGMQSGTRSPADGPTPVAAARAPVHS